MTKRHTTACVVWTGLLGILVSTTVTADAEADSVVLLQFDEGFQSEKLQTSDAAAAVIPGGKLSVKTGHEKPWPGVTLKAPSGKWDLSARAHVATEVTNRGKERVTVSCRVDNPGANGREHCISGNISLDAGATGILRVPLSPTPWRLSRSLDLVGMRAAPQATEKLDPANVTQVLFFVARPDVDHHFELGPVTAGGAATVLDAETFLPFIDGLGQFIHSEWPGKTRDVEDLRASVAVEAKDLARHPGPRDRNRFGGWTQGPKLEATGFFRVQKHRGKWWLVDPEGRLFWSHGTDCVRVNVATPISDREHYFQALPPQGSPLARFYGRAGWAPHGYYAGKTPYRTFDIGGANLSRKYGESWREKAAAATHRRLRSWGMNTIGNWSDRSTCLLRKTPYVVNISFSSPTIEGSQGYWGKFPDPFHPGFRESLRRRIAGEKGASAGDPWCIGYFVHNELSWGNDVSLAVAALASPPEQPAKKAFLEDLESRYETIVELNKAWGTAHESWVALARHRDPPEEKKARGDLAAFYVRVAETYFRTVREEVRKTAPHQLYLGCRFAWVNDSAARVAVKYCDVVGYNQYRYSVKELRLPGGLDKPVIIGEFHFGALDRGMFHTGLRPTRDQEDRAAKYRSYVQGALENPLIVGTHWFQYRDQATTGRGDGENYQIGLVDICDRPYPETILAVRETGYGLYEHRLGDTVFRDFFLSPPAAPWTWIRGNPESVRTEAGLWIKLEPGGLMGAGKNARNILVRPLPEDAHCVSVSVETQHRSQYEQAGLILYRDDDNYVKLVREFVDGKTWIVLVVEIGARARVLAKVPLPGGDTRIGLDLSRDGFQAWARGDSPDRVAVGAADFSMDPRPRMGVFTQSGQAGADRWARFSDFLIVSRPAL